MVRRFHPSRFGRHRFAAFVVAWLAAVVSALGASARLELDREFFETGDLIPLRIVVEDTQPTAVPPIPTSGILVSVEYSRHETRQQILNGVSSSQVILYYRGSLRGVGTLEIPPVAVNTAAGVLRTAPATLRVVSPEERTNAVSLHLFTSRDTCYLGEVLVSELQLHSRLNLSEATPPKMSFDGFVIGRTGPGQQSQVTRDGVVYGISATRQAVIPTKEGLLTLGPVSQEVVAEVGRRRPRSLLDDFFGGGAELQRIQVEAPGRKVQVLPLPTAGRPADFTGAIGRFRVQATVSKTNLQRGDAVTVKFELSGTGNFDTLPSPRLAEAPGLKTYPGTNQFQPSDTLGLSGTKVFEEAVVVDSADLKSLEFQPFSFFDPETGRYVTARLRPVAIQVAEAAGAVSPSPGTASEDASAAPPAPKPLEPIPRGPLPLKPSAGPAVRLEPRIADSPGFGLAILAPIVGLGILMAWRGIRSRRRRRAEPNRRQMAEMSLKDQMNALREAAAAGRSKTFFDALSAVLRQQVVLTLGSINGASTTWVDVEEPLRNLGLAEDSLSELRSLFAAADAARFAPMALPEELATWLAMTERVVQQLQALRKEMP